MTEWQDVIEAFADGESVDADHLKSALALAEGRDHLVDVLLVRQLVGSQGATRPLAVSAPARKAAVRWGWISAAAATIVLSVAGGYAVGHRTTGTTASASTSDAQLVTSPAPAPTRVIQLENGVDWTERGGGN